MSGVRIGVLGAGAVGLNTALILQKELPTAEIIVIAEKFNTSTTSDGAAGMFDTSSSFEAVNPQVTKNIVRNSYNYYEDLRQQCNEDTGIFQTSGFALSNQSQRDTENDLISDVVPEYRPATQEELPKGSYKYGTYFVTLMIEGRKFLPWALNRFQTQGGKVIQKRIESFHQLTEYNFSVIVNCLGLGAKELCYDKYLVPIRGQVLKVSAPWIKHFYIADDDTYIIPGCMDVTLGGCRHYGSYDLQVCPHTSQKILEGCRKVLPELKDTLIIREWVGLRPHRLPLRLEEEFISINGEVLKVVHNYGHGAQGITTAPGTSLHAVQLVLKLLQQSKI